MIILHLGLLLGVIGGVIDACDGKPRSLLTLSLPCVLVWLTLGLLFGWPVPE